MPARLDPSQIPSAPDLTFESLLWSNNQKHLAGLDEAGRGAWAGPVVAAAVILPESMDILQQLAGVRDSKQLSPAQRDLLAVRIKSTAAAWAVGFSDNKEIDEYGIVTATRLAMTRAVNQLTLTPDHLFLDALFLPEFDLPQTSLIKGDQRCLSISAASILAKTTRDEWMVRAHAEYPHYKFNQHKGYGTKTHQTALAEYGKCPLHRCSFKPIKLLL